MHRARVCARAARDGWRDESTVNNSGSKLKIRLVGPLGNLLLFPSMGRVSCDLKYPRRKVEIIMYYFGKTITCTACTARALAPRAKVGGMSQL